LFNVGYKTFHPEAGRAFLRKMMKQAAVLKEAVMLELMDFARAGWDDADIALRELILEYTNRGEALPALLATYNAEIITGRARPARLPARQPAAYFIQDIFIVMLITELVAQFNLKPTRFGVRRASASSIVADALIEAGLHRGGEKAVEKVWRRYGQAGAAAARAQVPGGCSRLFEEN